MPLKSATTSSIRANPATGKAGATTEAARASEAEKWRHFTVSTVFEGGRFDSRLYMANGGIDS
jgi:hypothetical protein